MSDKNLSPIALSPSYDVNVCDGFTTGILFPSSDATRFQFTFWMYDLTPDTEDKSVQLADSNRFQQTIKTRAKTAVVIDPSCAYSLALNILTNLSNLPDSVKEKFNIQFEMHKGDKADGPNGSGD